MSVATSKLWAKVAMKKAQDAEAKKKKPRLEYEKVSANVVRREIKRLPDPLANFSSDSLSLITSNLENAARQKRGFSGAGSPNYVLSVGEAFHAESLRVKDPIKVMYNLRSYFQDSGKLRFQSTGAYDRLKFRAEKLKVHPSVLYSRASPEKILQLEIERLMKHGPFKVETESEKKAVFSMAVISATHIVYELKHGPQLQLNLGI